MLHVWLIILANTCTTLVHHPWQWMFRDRAAKAPPVTDGSAVLVANFRGLLCGFNLTIRIIRRWEAAQNVLEKR